MANTKNNDIAPHILQKLFTYEGGDVTKAERKSVQEFCDWLPTLLHPVTKRPFEEISDYSMYRYIRGEQIPSWDVMYAVSHYFSSTLFSDIMNMAPWPGQEEQYKAKLKDAKAEAQKAMEKVKRLESALKKSKK